MKVETVIFPLQGMICRQCEDVICQRLFSTRGVIAVSADYWKGKVQIEYDPEIVNQSILKNVLSGIGYPVSEKARAGYRTDVICGFAILILIFLSDHLPLPDIPAIDNGASYGEIFLSGLVTGTHCIVMCGGIMLTTASAELQKRKRTNGWNAALGWNSGRVFICACSGMIFGAVGTVITYTVKLKSFVYTLAGLLVALTGLQMWGIIPPLRRVSLALPSPCGITSGHHGKIFRFPVMLGCLTGLMPCGASYSMWLIAMTAGSAIRGGLTMLFWALGTVPSMLLFAAFGTLLPQKAAKWMQKVNVVVITTLGLRMLINGLRLFQ